MTDKAVLSALDALEGLFGTRSKKVRGRAKKSLDLIAAMYKIAEAAQPITGRGVGYKLFSAKMIPSMSIVRNADGTKHDPMKGVYRLLKEAREEGIIPWEWIVDETRALEIAPSWSDPAAFVRTVSRAYRRDFWKQQPARVQVWSEKGTVRGVLAPVLDHYGVGFLPVHGFNGATVVHDTAQDDDGRPLKVLCVGDYDPSGMCMSEHDLPKRLSDYGGHHIELTRIALLRGDLPDSLSFPASDKRKDPRYKWFTSHYGDKCWELDAMDPNALRARVGGAIKDEIEPIAWRRCAVVYEGEKASLRGVLDSWSAAKRGGA
jgi:hypothetical protein